LGGAELNPVCPIGKERSSLQTPHGNPPPAGERLCGRCDATTCHLRDLAFCKGCRQRCPRVQCRAEVRSLLSLTGQVCTPDLHNHSSYCCCDSLNKRWQECQAMQTVFSSWRDGCPARRSSTAALEGYAAKLEAGEGNTHWSHPSRK